MSALATETIAFAAFGVKPAVDVPADLRRAAGELLPPGAARAADAHADGGAPLFKSDLSNGMN